MCQTCSSWGLNVGSWYLGFTRNIMLSKNLLCSCGEKQFCGYGWSNRGCDRWFLCIEYVPICCWKMEEILRTCQVQRRWAVVLSRNGSAKYSYFLKQFLLEKGKNNFILGANCCSNPLCCAPRGQNQEGWDHLVRLGDMVYVDAPNDNEIRWKNTELQNERHKRRKKRQQQLNGVSSLPSTFSY